MKGLLPYLLGSTGCLVLALAALWAFYAGKLHSDREFRKVERERDEYAAALAAERKAVDEYARTGGTTNALIAAMVQLASGRAQIPQGTSAGTGNAP